MCFSNIPNDRVDPLFCNFYFLPLSPIFQDNSIDDNFDQEERQKIEKLDVLEILRWSIYQHEGSNEAFPELGRL